jgi:hypothetical protein
MTVSRHRCGYPNGRAAHGCNAAAHAGITGLDSSSTYLGIIFMIKAPVSHLGV